MKKERIAFLLVISFLLSLFAAGNAFANQSMEKDSAIQNPETIIKSLDSKGNIPDQWNLPKPKVKPHPDVQPPVEGNPDIKKQEEPGVQTLSGNGDGINSISFGRFADGDIIVVLGTPTGHSGEFHYAKYGGNINNYCIWSANTKPVNGVQLETAAKYRAYDEAYGLWVPSLSYSTRQLARGYCELQKGEPYDINSIKDDQAKWYCSKLCWASYWYIADKDLDADGGNWVWPIDLVNDSDTSVFEHAT